NRPDENGPAGTYVELYRVTSTAEASRSEFALSGKVTRLGLEGQNLARKFFTGVRETSAFVQSEELAFAEYPIFLAIGGDHLPLAVSAAALQPGRRLIVKGVREADGL